MTQAEIEQWQKATESVLAYCGAASEMDIALEASRIMKAEYLPGREFVIRGCLDRAKLRGLVLHPFPRGDWTGIDSGGQLLYTGHSLADARRKAAVQSRVRSKKSAVYMTAHSGYYQVWIIWRDPPMNAERICA